MTNTAEERLIALLQLAIKEAEERGYERGVSDTMDKIQSVVLGSQHSAQNARTVSDISSGLATASKTEGTTKGTGTRKRAPKGLVRQVIRRALSASPGLTPHEIQGTAQGEDEKMISPNSYRSELNIGRKKGWYREENGKWYLVNEMKAEDAQSSRPSTFNQ